MTRFLTALATLAIGLFATAQPPHSRIAAPVPPAGTPSTQAPVTGQASPALSPTRVVEPVTGTPLAEAGAEAIPESIRQDLDSFGASQDLGTAGSIRAWLTDLDGDGAEDVLAEARFAADGVTEGVGEAVLYHFPYFAVGEAFRRGSAMALGKTVTSITQDGRRLRLVLQGEGGAADGTAPSVIVLSF